jgi:uncharacterized membrane protein YkvA (DUF1232 family)
MSNKKQMGPDPSFLSGLIKQLQLVWLLFKDKRVSLWTKLILPLSLLYLISPIDFLPDVIVGLGQLDDLSIVLLGLTLFVKLCPPQIVNSYRDQLEYGDDVSLPSEADKTIDTSYRVVRED